MGKYELLMDTGGHCFLCLKKEETPSASSSSPSTPALLNQSKPGGTSRTGRRRGRPTTVPPITSTPPTTTSYSFRNMFLYLETNLKEIFGQHLPHLTRATPVLDQSEIKGTLCDGCASRFQVFSKHYLELEVVQMKLQHCLKSMYDKIEENGGINEEVLEEFREEMGKDPETWVQYEMVDQLRRKTIEKCAELAETAVLPMVLLPRVEPPPPNVEMPVIMSICGNYDPAAAELLPDDELSSSIDDPAIDEDEDHNQDDDDDDDPPPPDITGGPAITIPSDNPQVSMSEIDKFYVHNPKTGKFKCVTCLEQYSGRSSFRVHYKSMHLKIKYTCTLCWKDFTLRDSYKRHQKSIHLNMRFKCQLCEANYSQKNDLVRHQRVAHFGKRYQCSYCPSTFTQSMARIRHMKGSCKGRKKKQENYKRELEEEAVEGPEVAGGNKNTYVCKYCNKIYANRSNKSRHHKICPARSKEGSKEIKRKGAYSSSSSSRPRRRVKRRKLSSYDYDEKEDDVEEGDEALDSVPSKELDGADDEAASTSLQTGEEELDENGILNYVKHPVTGQTTCGTCGKTFSNYSSFRKHYRVVHLRIRFQCQFCDVSFTQNFGLKQHEDTVHFGQRIKCDYCPKTFTQRSNRNLHMRKFCPAVPNGTVKPTEDSSPDATATPSTSASARVKGRFECGICHNKFRTLKARLAHQRTFHKGKRFPVQAQKRKAAVAEEEEEDDPNDPLKKIECPYCDKRFVQICSLHRHKRAAHSVRKPQYQCQACSKVFNDSGNRSRHMRLHCRFRKKTNRTKTNGNTMEDGGAAAGPPSLLPISMSPPKSSSRSLRTSSSLDNKMPRLEREVFSCQYCQESFKHPSIMFRHERRCSKGPAGEEEEAVDDLVEQFIAANDNINGNGIDMGHQDDYQEEEQVIAEAEDSMEEASGEEQELPQDICQEQQEEEEVIQDIVQEEQEEGVMLQGFVEEEEEGEEGLVEGVIPEQDDIEDGEVVVEGIIKQEVLFSLMEVLP